MAGQERTEKATPKHRKRARERGQVARSADLSGSLVMLAGLLALSFTGPHIFEAGASSFREILGEIARPGRATSAAGLQELMSSASSTIALTLGPIAAACLLAGLLGGVAQVGFAPTAQVLQPDFRRLNPTAGMRNLFGPGVLFETVKTLLKVGVVGGAVSLALLPGLTELAAHVGVTPGTLAGMMGRGAFAVAQRAAFAYLVIGLLDYVYRRYRHERQLRMTKQQVKEEVRQHGVSSEVKAALRRRQLQAARARMMAAVPKADVVIANPTHFAVALLYDGSHPAPLLLAKGQDLIAAQIRRVAEENEVPVITDPPLARALHSSTEVGQLIPQELYAAVAQVLAFVYRTSARRRMAS